jgi:prefoldin subunit 1
MERDLKNQEKALTEDINNLNKKVAFLVPSTIEFTEPENPFQVTYLEKQFNDAQSQLRDIVSADLIRLMCLHSKSSQFNSPAR